MTISRFMSMTATAVGVGALIALGGTSANAQVTSLGVGGAVSPVNDVSATPFGGTLQASETGQAFFGTTGSQTLEGTITSAVYSGGTASGGFGGTALDFYYQIFVSGASTGPATGISIASFSGVTLAVAQEATPGAPQSSLFTTGGTASNLAIRSGASDSGSAVSFFYNTTPIAAGGFSETLVIRTTSTSFSTGGGIGVLGSGVSANSTGLVISPIALGTSPEPGSIALIGSGLLTAGGMLIRRRRSTAA